MKRSPLRNKTPLRRKTPLRASTRFPSKGDPGTATAASDAAPVSLEALRFQKPARKAKAAPNQITRSRMKHRRARRIDRETPREKLFKGWIHRQECVGVKHLPGHVCSGRIEQSHLRSVAHGSGTGIKLDNFMSAAKCWGLAREWDVNQGPFDRWTKTERREWLLDRIAETRSRFDAEHPEAA